MILKITFNCGDKVFSIKGNFESEYIDLYDNYSSQIAEGYFRRGMFTLNKSMENKGSHFLYNYIEKFIQSEECPTFVNLESIQTLLVEIV